MTTTSLLPNYNNTLLTVRSPSPVLRTTTIFIFSIFSINTKNPWWSWPHPPPPPPPPPPQPQLQTTRTTKSSRREIINQLYQLLLWWWDHQCVRRKTGTARSRPRVARGTDGWGYRWTLLASSSASRTCWGSTRPAEPSNGCSETPVPPFGISGAAASLLILLLPLRLLLIATTRVIKLFLPPNHSSPPPLARRRRRRRELRNVGLEGQRLFRRSRGERRERGLEREPVKKD